MCAHVHGCTGITILALGNGAPDVFSTFVGVTTDSFSIAIGELTGTNIVNRALLISIVACSLKRWMMDVVVGINRPQDVKTRCLQRSDVCFGFG